MPVFRKIFARDPANPNDIASNATITLFDPADPNKTPVALTKLDGTALANPYTVNRQGEGPAFQHESLYIVGWEGGGHSGEFDSIESMHADTLAARTAAENSVLLAQDAQAAATNAGAVAAEEAVAEVESRIAAGEFKGPKGDPGLPGPDAIPADEAVAAYATTPGTATAEALNVAITDAVPARPLPSVATPCELQARFLDFGGGFMRGAVAGDSTVNDGNDPVRKMLIRLGQLTPSGVGMKERLWSTGSSTYATDVDVKPGSTTASTGGAVLTDNFNRTAAELVGSTTSGGQVWAGAAGAWSSNGTMATANSSTSALGYNTGTKAMTTTAIYSVVTTNPAAASQARLAVGTTQANFSAGGSYVWAQLALNTSGVLSVSVWKRVSGVNTEIVPTTTINGVTSSSAAPQAVTLKLDLAIQAVTLTVTVGGVDQVLSGTVTEGDTGVLGTYSGLAMPANANGSFKVDSVTMATPFTPGAYTGMEVWNAAVGGTDLTYQQSRIATMYPSGTTFDWILVTGGHNHGTEEPASFVAKVDGFVAAFKAAHPETRILISSQNPQFAPATTIEAHARRQAALRDYAMSKGYEYLPVFEAFRNQPDGGASLVNPADGIHPTVGTSTTDITTWCGNLLWTAVWLNVIESRRQTGVVPAITALP